MTLVVPRLCFFGCLVLQPAFSSTEMGVTCNSQWCHDFSRDCIAGTESQPCTCEKGIPRVIDKPVNLSVFAPRYYRYTCCIEGDPDSAGSRPRFTFERDVCGEYSGTKMRLASFLCAVTFAMGLTLYVGGRLYHGCVGGPAEITAEDEKVENPTTVLCGEQLHDAIPPHQWCVTRADLEQFRRLVRRAVLDRRIVPTDGDMFDPTDDVIGPCIYSITDQYIKPVTACAGNPSWALMLHPDGLACDLFITHSWKEGIYELIDKALYSWPASAKHAYICFLSNPQNLDIARLVSSPHDSPFAHALRSATDMMVVSNRRGSIYSRVWCTYEAHLAYTLDKSIFCATSPIHDFWPRLISQLGVSWVGLSIGVACCLLLVFSAFEHFAEDVRNLLIFSSVCTMLTYTVLRKTPWSTACRSSCFVAVLSAGMAIGFVLAIDITYLMNWVGVMFLFAFSFCMEADRLWAVVAVREKVNLCLGYTGHVRDAQCSVYEDGELIRRELHVNAEELAVDESIECLIRTGLSTGHLRETAQLVGKLGNVTNWNLANVVCNAGVIWVWVPAHSLGSNVCNIDRGILAYVCILQGVTWAVLFVFVLSKDHQAFASMSLVTMLACFAIRAISVCGFVFTTGLLIGPFVLTVTLAGPATVARIPVVGTPVVRFCIGEWKFKIHSICSRRARHPEQPEQRRRFSKELQNSQDDLIKIYGKLEQDLSRESRSSRSSTPPEFQGGKWPTDRMSRANTLSSAEGNSQSRAETLASRASQVAV